METFKDLYLGRPLMDFNRELIDRFLVYYETTTKKTACKDWQDIKTWARERGYPEKDFERARKAALREHESEGGTK